MSIMASYREEEDLFDEDIVFDQAGLLNNSTKRNSAIRRVSSGKCGLFSKTLGLCGAFFGLGLCIAIPGPTFLSPSMTLQADVSPVSSIYAARSCGYLIGAVIGGFLFDHFNRLFLLFISLLLTSIFIIVVPWCQIFWLLEACMVLLGVSMGFLDTGGNVLCLDLWGRNSPPFMQALHFSFGLGAFVAPLLAAPFLESPLMSDRVTNTLTQFPLVANHHLDQQHLFSLSAMRVRRDDGNPLNVGDNVTYNVTLSIATSDVPSTDDSTVTTARVPKPKPSKTDGSKLGSENWDRIHVGKPPLSDLVLPSTTLATTSPTSLSSTSSIPPMHDNVTSLAGATLEDISSTEDSASVPQVLEVLNTTVPQVLEVLNATFPQVLEVFNTTVPQVLEVLNTTVPQVLEVHDAVPQVLKVLNTTVPQVLEVHDTTVPQAPEVHDTTVSQVLEVHDTTVPQVLEVHDTTPPAFLPTSLDLATPTMLVISVATESLPTREVTNQLTTFSKEGTSLNNVPNTHDNSESLYQEVDTDNDEMDDEESNVRNELAIATGKYDSVFTRGEGDYDQDPVILKSSLKENDGNGKLKESSTVESIPWTSAVPKHLHHLKPGTYDNDTEDINTIFNMFASGIEKYGLTKMQFTYLIVGLFVFVVSLVFLGFLCHNPRDPKSKQEEGQGSKKIISANLSTGLVCVMSVFLFLYVGLEVTYGQMIVAYAVNSNLKLMQATGSLLAAVFWGTFSIARFASIFASSGLSPASMMFVNFFLCTSGTIVLSSMGNTFEWGLWLGTILLAIGLASIFPTSILWIERYIHVSNKAAAVFIIAVTLGQMVCPIIVYHLMVFNPSLLLHSSLVINILCIVCFGIMWKLASKLGEKYCVVNNNGYQLANQNEEEDDLIEMSPSRGGLAIGPHSLASEHRALLNGNSTQLP